MADAGGIVGTISLTLQVLQGLKWYYSQFTAYGDDITSVVTRIGLIEDNLGLLETAVQRLKRDDDAIIAAVRTSIAACEDAVHRLKAYQKKCGEPEYQPDTAKKKAVLLKRRVLYPLRKDTLEDVQKQLDRLLENLQVIMQALQLDTTIRFHHQTESKAGAIHDELTFVRSGQTYQSELLEHIDGTIERHSTQFSQHASQTESMVHGQTLRMGEMVEQLNRLCMSVGKIEQAVSRTRTPPPLTMLRESCDTYVDTIQAVRRVAKAHEISQSSAAKHPLSHLVCSCPKNIRRRIPPPSRWFSTFRVKESKHLPGCPFAIPSQNLVTIGLRIRACWGALGYLVEANLEWSNRSLSPRILTRNVVSNWTSAAFQLISAFQNCAWELSSDERSDIKARFQPAFTMTIEALLRLLHDKRTSVFDVDSYGNSLVHHFFGAAALWICETSEHSIGAAIDIDHVQAAFRFFCDNGYDMNEISVHGSAPMDIFLSQFHLMNQAKISEVFGRLADVHVLRDFEYSYTILHNSSVCARLYRVYAIVSSQEAFKYGCEDSALAKAIYRQSHTELRRYLEGPENWTAEEDACLSLYLAADWPLGLQLLLEHGFAHCSRQDKYLNSALDWAIELQNLESVEILVHDLTLLTEETWYYTLRSKSEDIIKAVASALYQKFKSSCEELPRFWKRQPPRAINYSKLFHGFSMSPEAAHALFDAGFRDVDINLPYRGTPLWLHSLNYAGFEYTPSARLITWFVERGAKLDSIHPIWETMPLHLLAEKFVVCYIYHERSYQRYKRLAGWDKFLPHDQPDVRDIYVSETSSDGGNDKSDVSDCNNNSCDTSEYNEDDDISPGQSEDSSDVWPPDVIKFHKDLFTSIFENESRDHCTCRCAVDGCSAISSALKVARSCEFRFTCHPRGVVHLQKRALHEILTYLSNPTYHSQIFSSTLRTMTFDALGLTHTCHNHGHTTYGSPQHTMYCDPKPPLSEEYIRDIQYTEEDIHLLETLLVEFEGAWNAWNGEFLEFIDGHWIVRMEEVLTERDAPQADEVKKLESLGVNVRGYGPELSSPAEERPKLGAWEEFERRVQAIMSGEQLEDDWFFSR